ncbi:unnamed protein product [Cuscuta epithymum]|uniref:Uncharacterized protein n=1 Tax=Cuscuta epithymum TaxID=186058 RepID=A0AAV0DWP9_9ASTE|nr:unnamed protein product [Cuscuta epithymum]
MFISFFPPVIFPFTFFNLCSRSSAFLQHARRPSSQILEILDSPKGLTTSSQENGSVTQSLNFAKRKASSSAPTSSLPQKKLSCQISTTSFPIITACVPISPHLRHST